MRAKQKIVHGRGLSNLNLGIFACSFDVYRASKLVPSINYAQRQIERPTMVFKSLQGLAPEFLRSKFVHRVNKVNVPQPRSKYHKNSFY